MNKMLGDEYGTASNIKSRVNRLSVLSAITSTQQVCVPSMFGRHVIFWWSSTAGSVSLACDMNELHIAEAQAVHKGSEQRLGFVLRHSFDGRR